MCAQLVGSFQESFGTCDTVREPRFDQLVYGVPQGGPFDLESAQLCRALVGAQPESALLELTPGTFKIEFQCSISVSLVGAICPILLDGDPRPPQSAFLVQKGQTLELRPTSTGLRIYLGLPGGAWRIGSELWTESVGVVRDRTLADPPTTLTNRKLRFVPSQKSVEWSQNWFSPTMQSSRTGIRLSPKIEPHDENIVSEPTTPGVIQHTPGGELLVIGPDGPTLGGYPKLGTLTRYDLSCAAQIAPYMKIELEQIDVPAARLRVDNTSLHILRKVTELSLRI